MKHLIKFLGNALITLTLAIVSHFQVLAQPPDLNAMTKEERDAYFAKLRDASVEDHKKMMKLLNIDSIRQGRMVMIPTHPMQLTMTSRKQILFPTYQIR